MVKFSKLIGIIFVLSLLALPLTGCMESSTVLTLNVDTPSNNSSVTTPTITVSGHLSGMEKQSGKVKINGAEVPVKDTKFSTDVKLAEGKNTINIGATFGTVDLKEQVTITYAPAK